MVKTLKIRIKRIITKIIVITSILITRGEIKIEKFTYISLRRTKNTKNI